jgi:hypothetical protein
LLTLTSLFQFHVILCIAHCLFQRSKPVSRDVKLGRYLFLIFLSSGVILVTTCSIFLVIGSSSGSTSGWLSLSMTWSAALITPILASALISSVWLLQAASMSSHLRPTAVKFQFYLLTLTTTCTLVLLDLVYWNDSSSWFEWLLTVAILVTTMVAAMAMVPKLKEKKTPKSSTANQNLTQSWMQIDNRSSVADFRYIPVVHNVHSTNYYQKPKSIERLYTEIIPERNDVIENGPPLMSLAMSHALSHSQAMSHSPAMSQAMSHSMRMTMPNQIACTNPNVDWTTPTPFHLPTDSFQSKTSHDIMRHPEDSGVHTAQNSSDSASSERNSPIVDDQLHQTENETHNQTLPEQRQSLLEQHHRHSSMGDIHV